MGQHRFALLAGSAWLLVSAQLVALYWTATGITLLDTDDAMRLVQVRDFLAGQSWFDLHQARVQPPAGYDSHWSRLIDAGLAGLFLLLDVFVDQPLAERLTRTVWPLLWLLPTMLGAAAAAWRLGGRDAALIALLSAVLGLPALQKFRPGSIDHHNVQIALCLLVLAATVWADRVRWACWAAGGLTGLALAIGFESLPYLVACGSAFAVRYLCDRGAAPALRAYGIALALATLAAFVVSVAPAHWARTACDAIAINMLVPVLVAGTALAILGGIAADDDGWSRAILLAAAGCAALATFLALDPRCIAGPFAALHPDVRQSWLSQVREMQPLIAFARNQPVSAAAMMAFPTAALVCGLVLAVRPEDRGDAAYRIVAAVFLVALATTFAVIKAYTYAIWLGMPLAAAAALRLVVRLRLRTVAARATVALLLTPGLLASGAVVIAEAAGGDPSAASESPGTSACFDTASYAPLRDLPSGVVAADIDYGPFLLAHTPHSVLAAPYHRLSDGIIAVYRAMQAPPDQAREILQRSTAVYVVVCKPLPPSAPVLDESRFSLRDRLAAGAPPDWLEPLPGTQAGPFQAYRLKP